MQIVAHFVAGFWCILLLVTVSAAVEVPPIRLEGQTMGTYYTITIDSPPATADPKVIRGRIEEVLAEFNRQMSTWDPESEISAFNKSISSDWFPVSRNFVTVVQESQRIHQLTNGFFDPTVAPLIELWGFGSEKQRAIPDESQIQQTMSRVGMQQIEVRLEPPAIRKVRPEVQMNLSAIAPGFANDLLADELEAMGFQAYLVDIGGESRAGLPRAGGRAWRIGVESPHEQIYKIVELVSQGVATSGDYRNFFEMNGRRYSHAIHPVTGWPVENAPASVSILHESSMTADALGTALMVMGTEQGIRFAKEHDLDVTFLDVDSAGRIVETSNGVFASISPLRQEDSNAASDADQSSAQLPPAEAEAAEKWWLPYAAAAGIFLLAMTGMSIGVLIRKRYAARETAPLVLMAGRETEVLEPLVALAGTQ